MHVLRFLRRVAGFVLPLLLLAAGAELGLRSIPHPLGYKARYMEQHGPELEVLSLGLSHAFYGLNFSDSPYRSFNLAYHGQPLERDLELWELYADRLTSLRAVYISLSCWSIHHRLRLTGEQWRVPFYTIHYRLPGPRYDVKRRCILAYPTPAFRYLKHSLFRRAGSRSEGDIPQDERGSYMALRSLRRPDWDRPAEGQARTHSTFDRADVEHNRRILRRLVGNCAERSIRVVLYTPPGWHTYTDYLSDEVVELTRSIGEELAEEFPGVQYLDLLRDDRFTTEDFFDASHLNYDSGGAKLARILEAALCSEAQ